MKRFNTTGICKPSRHYMVDITERLEQIKALVDDGEYFVINRARQYGKTTTLVALKEFLSDEYIVVSLDFQMMAEEEFENSGAFTRALARQIYMAIWMRDFWKKRVESIFFYILDPLLTEPVIIILNRKPAMQNVQT